MADETPPLDEARLEEIRATLSDEEGMSDIKYRLTSEWASVRFSAEVKLAARELLAEVDRLRAEHNEAWDLIDRLAEDLADHAPLAHDWLIDEANAWREKHPKTPRP